MQKLAIVTLLAGAFALSGCVVREIRYCPGAPGCPETYGPVHRMQTRVTGAPGAVYATSQPPAALTETISVQPSANTQWLDGFWHWNGIDWVWVSGKWLPIDESMVYVRPYYDWSGSYCTYYAGYWDYRNHLPHDTIIIRDQRDHVPWTRNPHHHAAVIARVRDHRRGGKRVPPPTIVRDHRRPSSPDHRQPNRPQRPEVWPTNPRRPPQAPRPTPTLPERPALVDGALVASRPLPTSKPRPSIQRTPPSRPSPGSYTQRPGAPASHTRTRPPAQLPSYTARPSASGSNSRTPPVRQPPPIRQPPARSRPGRVVRHPGGRAPIARPPPRRPMQNGNPPAHRPPPRGSKSSTSSSRTIGNRSGSHRSSSASSTRRDSRSTAPSSRSSSGSHRSTRSSSGGRRRR